jgi:hypothetical protein
MRGNVTINSRIFAKLRDDVRDTLCRQPLTGRINEEGGANGINPSTHFGMPLLNSARLLIY